MLPSHIEDQSIEGGRAVRCPGDQQRRTVYGQPQGGSIVRFAAFNRRCRADGVRGQLPGKLVVGVDGEILGSPPAQDSVGSPGDSIQIQYRQRPASFSSDEADRGRRKAPNGDHAPME